MITKDSIQKEVLNLTDNNIVLEWSTGVGKSLASIRLVEKFGGDWNIVIAETNHELNWIEEFKKHGKEHLLNRVKFFCYQSLKKHLLDENYVFDEVHHLFSQTRINLFTKLKSNNLKRFIGLSATLKITQKQILNNILGNINYQKISLSDAIDSGLLPEPTVYIVSVELDTVKKDCKFHFSRDKYIMCTQREMYNRMCNRIAYLKDQYFNTRQEFDKIKWLKAANDRKKFLSECKTPHAIKVLEYLRYKRLICFTGSVKQAEEISDGALVHSGIIKGKREDTIKAFNEGKIDKLFATGMLKEGINLNNIQAGLIIQLDNQQRYFVQINGRTMRSIAPEQYILVVSGTQDEVYVNTVLEDFNMEYVKYKSINELII